MSYRFFRRVRIAPGLTINLSKSRPSLSVGGRGAHVTLGGSRGRRTTVGVPGTGVFWTSVHRQATPRRTIAGPSPAARAHTPVPAPVGGTPRIQQQLSLSFFRRLVTPADEQAFVDGLRAMVEGDNVAALAHLRGATHLADGAFVAGCLALQAGALDEAATDLDASVAGSTDLGRTFDRCGIAVTLALHVTDEISAALAPNLESALLALVEAYQHLGRTDDALAGLRRLQALAPAEARRGRAQRLGDSCRAPAPPRDRPARARPPRRGRGAALGDLAPDGRSAGRAPPRPPLRASSRLRGRRPAEARPSRDDDMTSPAHFESECPPVRLCVDLEPLDPEVADED